MSIDADPTALAEHLPVTGVRRDLFEDSMPPGDDGFSRRFAWVGDRFGVTWQLNAA